VSRAVLLALDGVVGADGQLDTNRTEAYVPNEFVADMAARHTNLLFGASSENYQGERGPDRLARLLREYPNLWADISALTQINKPGCLKAALRKPEFSGRLVYGTDLPLINTALVSPWYSFRLSLREKISIWRTKNPWERDVLMKHDLGVPTEAFVRPARMFVRR
jgi:hypothetical protein